MACIESFAEVVIYCNVKDVKFEWDLKDHVGIAYSFANYRKLKLITKVLYKL
jgi:hypothetical protein